MNILMKKRLQNIDKNESIDIIKRRMDEAKILSEKVDIFLNWYKKNNNSYNIYAIEPENLIKFVEKMVAWYELRYTDSEIERILGVGDYQIPVGNEIIYGNDYFKTLLGETNNLRDINWCDIYTFDAFYKSLSKREKYFISKPKYPEIVCLYPRSSYIHVHLDEDGYITCAEGFHMLGVNGDDYCGLHIKTLVDILNNTSGFKFPFNSEFISTIEIHKIKEFIHESIYDLVLYKLLDRHYDSHSFVRSYFFAKEFNRDLSIPIQYGVNFRDDYLRVITNDYLNNGGDRNLECYINYERENKRDNYTLTSVSLKNIVDDWALTNEEKELYQRFVEYINMYKKEREESKKKVSGYSLLKNKKD